MKKVITILTLIVVANSTFSQQNEPVPALSKQYYLKKSKNQKTVAWILVSVGALSTSLGSVSTNPNGYFGGESSNSNSTVFLVAGLAAIGASVPLFIASSKNKKKSMSMSFKMQPVPQFQKIDFVSQTIPSLNLKISL